MVTNETLYESALLTKDMGVIQGLLTDGDQWTAEKNWTKIELTNNQMFLNFNRLKLDWI